MKAQSANELTKNNRASACIRASGLLFAALFLIVPTVQGQANFYKCPECGVDHNGQDCPRIEWKEKERKEKEKEKADQAEAESLEEFLAELRRRNLSYSKREELEKGGNPTNLRSTAKGLRNHAAGIWRSASQANQNGNYSTADARWEAKRKADQAESDAKKARRDAESNAFWDNLNKPRKAPRTELYTSQQAYLDDLNSRNNSSQSDKDGFGAEVGNGLVDEGFNYARDKVSERGYRTRIPGEAIANNVKDYVDTARERADSLNPLNRALTKGIRENIAPRVNELLNRPNEASGNGNSSGYGGGSGYSRQTAPTPSYTRPAYVPPPGPTPEEIQYKADREHARRIHDILGPILTPSPGGAGNGIPGFSSSSGGNSHLDFGFSQNIVAPRRTDISRFDNEIQRFSDLNRFVDWVQGSASSPAKSSGIPRSSSKSKLDRFDDLGGLSDSVVLLPNPKAKPPHEKNWLDRFDDLMPDSGSSNPPGGNGSSASGSKSDDGAKPGLGGKIMEILDPKE